MGVSRIGALHDRRQAESLQIVPDQLAARFIHIRGQQREGRLPLQQMAGLAARRRTGVEGRPGKASPEQGDRELRRLVLHPREPLPPGGGALRVAGEDAEGLREEPSRFRGDALPA